MAGGSVLNNRVDNMLEVSRSIGDVWFKKSYQTRSFGFLLYSLGSFIVARRGATPGRTS